MPLFRQRLNGVRDAVRPCALSACAQLSLPTVGNLRLCIGFRAARNGRTEKFHFRCPPRAGGLRATFPSYFLVRSNRFREERNVQQSVQHFVQRQKITKPKSFDLLEFSYHLPPQWSASPAPLARSERART